MLQKQLRKDRWENRFERRMHGHTLVIIILKTLMILIETKEAYFEIKRNKKDSSGKRVPTIVGLFFFFERIARKLSGVIYITRLQGNNAQFCRTSVFRNRSLLSHFFKATAYHLTILFLEKIEIFREFKHVHTVFSFSQVFLSRVSSFVANSEGFLVFLSFQRAVTMLPIVTEA